MAKTIKFATEQSLFNGWGFVEGQWVYVPLWDPAPIAKKFRGYKKLLLANAIHNIGSKVSSAKVVGQLNVFIKEQLSETGKSSLASWEEGDGICPEWWPFPSLPGGLGPIGPDPDNPVYFPKNLSKKLVDALAGHLLISLGKTAGHPGLQQVGKELMG